ncbi:hypothetical protein ACIGEP_14695 [Microbacterium sp. NPDC077663]|uniref:hypothetical protein n=1 Tax=Microbacterium sp. NPDC077663 TaxID=3364189 RepID=UPI0037CB7106
MATIERPAGTWTLATPDGDPYGRVEIRRQGELVFYRCWLRDVELNPQPTPRAATVLIHRAYIATLSPGPPPGGPAD